MIQMVTGFYGLLKDGKVIRMTPESGPFKTSQAEENRLVQAGLAVYVKKKRAAAHEPERDDS